MKVSFRHLLTKKLAAYAFAVTRIGNSVERSTLQRLAAEYESQISRHDALQPKSAPWAAEEMLVF